MSCDNLTAKNTAWVVKMVSPRRDRWVVTADKPKGTDRFDSLVDQPFQSFSRGLGYGSSLRVFELFATEEEARHYAALIQLFGATRIHVSPPEPPTALKQPRIEL